MMMTVVVMMITGVREGGSGGSMDPPVDVPATPTRCIFGLFSRVILGRRMRKRKKNKKEGKKVYSVISSNSVYV